jgi:thiol-disulfide isomerase/thioredoxin
VDFKGGISVKKGVIGGIAGIVIFVAAVFTILHPSSRGAGSTANTGANSTATTGTAANQTATAGGAGNATPVASASPSPAIGSTPPNFTLPTYPSGKTVSLASLKGKPVFINIWASWCPPCKMETPDIVKAHAKYGSKVEFVSINASTQDSLSGMEAFIKHYGIKYPVEMDTQGQFLNSYHIVGFPTSFFINRKGVIVDEVLGAITSQHLNQDLQKISQ